LPQRIQLPSSQSRVFATVVRQTLPDARKSGERLRKESLAAFRKGYSPDIQKPFIRDNLSPIATAMTFSYLQAYKNVKQSAPLGLSEDMLHRAVERLSKSLKLDTKQLAERFKIIGFRALKTASDKLDIAVRKVVIKLIDRGAHIDEAIETLSDTFDLLGISPAKSHVLETIFRTASSIGYGAGSWQAYQDPDIQDILWGYYYTAVGDDRTRENHLAADGVTLPKDHEFWQTMWVPNGYNCRCNIIALYDEQPIVEPPAGAYPDEGWGYNPGIVIERGASSIALSFDESEHPRDEKGKFAEKGGGIAVAEETTVEADHYVETYLKKHGRTVNDIVSLVAAQDGSHVVINKIDANTFSGIFGISVEVLNEKYKAARFISFENREIMNESLDISEQFQRQGLGTKLLYEQVASAKALGFEKLKTFALRHKDANGYYVWPKLGYDALFLDNSALDKPFKEKYGPRISDVMKTKAGRDEWLQKGHSMHMEFSLNDKSSLEILTAARRVHDPSAKSL